MISAQTRKLEIIEQVLHLESEEELGAIEQALELLQTGNELLDNLPVMSPRSAAELQARYAQSLRELDNGEGIPHEQVKALMQDRYQL